MTANVTPSFTPDPLPAEWFVGREREIEEIVSHQLGTQRGLINLVGPSKIGRTSLLRRVQALMRTSGGGTPYARLFGGSRTIIAPYIDLNTVTAGPAAESWPPLSVIVRGIVREIHEHHSDLATTIPALEEFEWPDAFENLEDHFESLHGGVQVLLLVDRAEYLLRTTPDPSPEHRTDAILDALGKLNESVLPLGIALAFGTSGPVQDLSALTRGREERELLRSTSAFLGLSLSRIDLGLLSTDEVADFASRALVSTVHGRQMPLSAEEVEWIADLAGGHPYVLQLAGVESYRLKTAESARGVDPTPTDVLRKTVEDALIASLGPFVHRALVRSDLLADEATLRTVALSGGEAVTIDAQAAEALAGEGLVVLSPSVPGTRKAQMPSAALRRAVLAELATNPDGRPGNDGTYRPRQPAFSASTTKGGQLLIARLSSDELSLMQCFLDAPAGSVLTRDALLASIEAGITAEQLTQRLSVLRGKLKRDLLLEPTIEAVYRQGYRLENHDRITLRGAG
jgi:hypothetical protein